MKSLLTILAALMLTACGTPAKLPPERVEIPVAVGCAGEKPERPTRRYGKSASGAYPGDKVAAQLAILDADAFETYSNGLEAAMAGCAPKGQRLP